MGYLIGAAIVGLGMIYWASIKHLITKHSIKAQSKECAALEREIVQINLNLDLFAIIVQTGQAIPEPSEKNSIDYLRAYKRFIIELQYLQEQLSELSNESAIFSDIDSRLELLENLQETLFQYDFLKDRFSLEIENVNPARNDAIKIKAEAKIYTLRHELLKYKREALRVN